MITESVEEDLSFCLTRAIRAGLSLVDTLSHLSIETYQSTRVVIIAYSSNQRKSGIELTEMFQISMLFEF